MPANSALHKVSNEILRGGLRRFSFLYPIYAAWVGSRFQKAYGFRKGAVLISFDVDYKEDNDAVDFLLPLLKKHHVRVTWAAIGKWMQSYPDRYKQIIEDGHEIMNHSWSHPDNAQLRPGDSRKFHQIEEKEVDEEISKANKIALDLFGYQMEGFRLPHFREHPQVTRILNRLKYVYTSNEFGIYSQFAGLPYRSASGLVEIPLSSIPRVPTRIVETYRLVRKPDGLYPSERHFYNDFCQLVTFSRKLNFPAVFYLDPSDVALLSAPDFEECLAFLENSQVDILTYRQFARVVNTKQE